MEVSFPHFIDKMAPVTGARQNMLPMHLFGFLQRQERHCPPRCGPGDNPLPCSKEISDYGAHNQRGHVTIEGDHEDSKEGLGVDLDRRTRRDR